MSVDVENVNDETDNAHGRFAGARRAQGFDEPVADIEPAAAGSAVPSAPAGGWDRFVTADEAAPSQPGGWPITPAQREAPAQWGAKRHWVRIASLGFVSAKPGAPERAHRAAETLIRSASWPRPVRVAVVNPKGGIGKTPTAIILAGIMAQLRGGGVVAWDAGDSAGSLALRSEGTQSACISDVVADPGAYSTPGTIAAAVARQSSFAGIIGSRHRREFDQNAIYSVMNTLDQSFSISLADTGNVPHSPAFRYAVGYSDAIVIPTAATRDSVERAIDVLAQLQATPRLARLAQRATVVINRGLGAEEQIAAQCRDIFTNQGVCAVLDVPFDKAIAANGVLRPADLNHQSQAAWTQVSAAVVSSVVINNQGQGAAQ